MAQPLRMSVARDLAYATIHVFYLRGLGDVQKLAVPLDFPMRGITLKEIIENTQVVWERRPHGTLP